MSGNWGWVGSLLASLLLTGCGNEAIFDGQNSRSSQRRNENGPTDPSLDQTQGGSGSDAGAGQDAGEAGKYDARVDGGQGDGKDEGVVNVPATSSLFWHWPCMTKPSSPVPTDPAAMVITGGADFMLAAKDVKLEIGGEACSPGSGPRDVLFVVDVSDSMRNFLNLGNDPVKNGTCGRSNAVKQVLDELTDAARVALITFDGDLQTVSDGYLPVADFRAQYAKTSVLCKSGNNTNFKKAFASSLAQLVKARKDAAKELYFLSDGEANSSDVDGHEEAAEIKKTATIATLMLKGDATYMRDVLASRDAQAQPLHAKVTKAADLATALGLLAQIELKEAKVAYGAVGDEANWQVVDLGLPDDLTFHVAPWTLKQSEWAGGLGFKTTTVDSKGLKTEASGKLLWKP